MIKSIDFFAILQFLYRAFLSSATLADVHIIQMINKIQSTVGVAFKSQPILSGSPEQSFGSPEEEIKSIHSYFVMLRHIFQKNKELMRKRNQSSLQNRTEIKVIKKKIEKVEKNEESGNKVKEQYFGILKNGKVNNCNIITQRQSRYYRPYRSKNRSVNLAAKCLSTSVPNIKQEKDDGFEPIGQKYQQCKAISPQQKRSLSKSRTQFSTCINFYPKHQRKDSKIKGSAIQLNKPQLKKQRRTLLVPNRRTISQPSQSQSLRSSHKSHLSMATQTSEVPSPW